MNINLDKVKVLLLYLAINGLLKLRLVDKSRGIKYDKPRMLDVRNVYLDNGRIFIEVKEAQFNGQ